MLGKGARISWQPCQKRGKMQRKQLSGWPLILYIGYAAALSLLLVFAAFRIVRDHFILEFGESGQSFIRVIVMAVLGILVWNELLSAFGKTKLRWVGSLMLLSCITLGCLWYCRGHEKEVIDGISSIGQQYMAKWRIYFHISQQIAVEAAEEEALIWRMAFLLGTVWFQTLSALLRKRSVMLLFPTAALAAEMIVGLTPGWSGLACMCAAGILCLYLDCHREFRAAPALILAVLMGLLLPLVGLLMVEPASRVNLVHDRMLAFQHRMEREIQDFNWQELVRREGQVDNHTPSYQQKEVIRVTASAVPTGNLYLRGYYGMDYDKGSWKAGTGTFERTCLQHGISSRRAAELLVGLSSEYGAGDKVQYELQYTGLRSSYVYLPYGADLETVKEQYRLDGDYVAEKRSGLKSFHFTGRSTYRLTQTADGMEDGDAKKLCAWYNEYVLKHYLGVPEELTVLTDMVRDMEQSQICRNALEMLASEDIAERNAARLSLGSLVADRLSGHADYNLSPDELPKGQDPVEYFLEEGKEGYCTHFASAGVLLLRRLGVPARYVSGYVVQQEQFVRESGSYAASVKDEAAHAWAEIWLDDRGWVPVEMTPGYGEAVLMPQEEQTALSEPSKEEVTKAPEPSESLPEEEIEPEEKPALEETEEEETEAVEAAKAVPTAEIEAPGDKARPEDSQQPGSGESDMSGTDIFNSADGTQSAGSSGSGRMHQREGWGFAGEGGWAVFGQNGSLRVSHVIGGILAGLLAAGAGYFLVKGLIRRKKSRWEKIRAGIASGSSRRAVRTINRRLYRQLRQKRAGVVFLRSDEEYLKALKQQYPQISGEEWERYFGVVRQAVYSREAIGREEAEMCYRLLERTQRGKR